MKSFNQFIQEEYHSLFKGSPIFINPSKADIIEIGKTADYFINKRVSYEPLDNTQI